MRIMDFPDVKPGDCFILENRDAFCVCEFFTEFRYISATERIVFGAPESVIGDRWERFVPEPKLGKPVDMNKLKSGTAYFGAFDFAMGMPHLSIFHTDSMGKPFIDAKSVNCLKQVYEISKGWLPQAPPIVESLDLAMKRCLLAAGVLEEQVEAATKSLCDLPEIARVLKLNRASGLR